MPRVSVLQPGARLHYGLPALLARADLLDVLFTDIHAEHWWLKGLSRLVPNSLLPASMRRLLGRRLPAVIPNSSVHDRAGHALAAELWGRIGGKSSAAAQQGIVRALLADVERKSWRPGDALYTVLINEDYELVARLKDRGVRIIHECMIGPDVGLWVAEERRLFPGIEADDDAGEIERGRERDARKYALCDLILVPSEFTKAGVVALAGVDKAIKLVPYGLDLTRFTHKAQPAPGRVLFVGTVGLRKGVHYLAEAARLLKARNPGIEVRVVGPVDPHVLSHPLFEGPTYVGQVPRSQVQEEFARADVFVLPSLCEGSALAHIEALAAGVPVVTTPNCGSVVRDGVEGYIVGIRDASALAERIAEIVGDREARARMSVNAIARAEEFSLEQYQRRLLDCLDAELGIRQGGVPACARR